MPRPAPVRPSTPLDVPLPESALTFRAVLPPDRVWLQKVRDSLYLTLEIEPEDHAGLLAGVERAFGHVGERVCYVVVLRGA